MAACWRMGGESMAMAVHIVRFVRVVGRWGLGERRYMMLTGISHG